MNGEPQQPRKKRITFVQLGIVVLTVSLVAIPVTFHFIRVRQRAEASMSITRMNTPGWAELTPYLNKDGKIVTRGDRDSSGNAFTLSSGSTRLQVITSTASSLSSVAGDPAFWGPYS